MTQTLPRSTVPGTAQPPAGQGPARSHGRPGPAWVRPALLTLLAGTAVLYLWNLSASGDANSFYAAAAQAGTQSWKAMLFGSLDAGNAITVDKPAAFLWPMELAGRIFGFSSASMLFPQALEGVAAVGLLYDAVRRVAGPIWGLLAGAMLAVTPAAVLMFRFNNPDALLVLLLTGALYATVRAFGSTARAGRWIALAGLLVGFGFITKMGQALLVVPAIGFSYLLFGRPTLLRRIGHLLAGGLTMVLGAGWWIALVELWPASSRPYIGGSTNNSVLELALGYNGLGRLLGNAAGGGPGGGGGPSGGGPGGGQNSAFGGATGLFRLFHGELATEISWVLPAAVIAVVVGLLLTWKASRTDARRGSLLLFGTALLVTAGVFSFMRGTIHPYYTIALAPLVAAVVAITCSVLWEQRDTWLARIVAAVMIEATAIWAVHLLAGYPSFLPWLRVLVVAAAGVAAVAIVFGPWLRQALLVAAVAAVLGGLGASAAFGVATAAVPHGGNIPSAGPATPGGFGGAGGAGPGGGFGGVGSAGQTDSSGSDLTRLLSATTTKWAAATNGSMSAAPLQLAIGRPVIAIGGFTGSDNAPTLQQFKAWVAAGEISYYIAGGMGGIAGGPSGDGGAGSQIEAWVTAHYSATSVGGRTVYDLRVGSS